MEDTITNIYKITNNITNKIYIGKTNRGIEERFDQHITKGRKILGGYGISQSLREYGSINHTIEIIEVCDDVASSQREQYWIEKNDSLNNGYNRRNQQSNANKTYHNNKKQALLNLELGNIWNKGISPSIESINRSKKTFKTNQNLGLHNKYGHTHSPESKKKISLAKQEFFNKGGNNSNSKYFDVIDNKGIIMANSTSKEIMKKYSLTRGEFTKLRKHARENDEIKIHPKYDILIKSKGKIYV